MFTDTDRLAITLQGEVASNHVNYTLPTLMTQVEQQQSTTISTGRLATMTAKYQTC